MSGGRRAELCSVKVAKAPTFPPALWDINPPSQRNKEGTMQARETPRHGVCRKGVNGLVLVLSSGMSMTPFVQVRLGGSPVN